MKQSLGPSRVIWRRSQPIALGRLYPFKADIGEPISHVGFGPQADIAAKEPNGGIDCDKRDIS